MIFKSFQILAALLSKCSQLVGLLLGVKRFLTSVWHVFVSQLVQSSLFSFFMALRSLLGVLILSIALQIELYKTLRISEKG